MRLSFPPGQYFKDNDDRNSKPKVKYSKPATHPVQEHKPVSYIPKKIFQKSMEGYRENHFFTILEKVFGEIKATELAKRYHIGASTHWEGATIFWQVDEVVRVRTGKVMLFNPKTYGRVKKPYNHISWMHSILRLPDYNLKQCLFGQHLVRQEPDKIIAITESEKSAVIAAGLLPNYLWLAAGGVQNLSLNRCRALRGRKVILYPDLSCYEEWQEIAEQLKSIAAVTVSELLEKYATAEQKQQGLDIGDYLLKQATLKATVPQPIRLLSSDIQRIPVTTVFGRYFSNIQQLLINTKGEKYYDILFDAAGEPLSLSECKSVGAINAFFNKYYRLGFMDDTPCFIQKVSTINKA